MCGRYAATASPDELVAEFEVARDDLRATAPRPDTVPVEPSWNVAPTTTVPVVLTRRPHPAGEEPAQRCLQGLRWGLVPSWAKDLSVGARMINARAESLLDKPAFRRAAVSRRCLVPAAGGYEWQLSPVTEQPGGKPRKQPFFMQALDQSTLAFAGVYEFWRDPGADGDDPASWWTTFAIITTAAEPGLDRIHDRMPLVMPSPLWQQWLDPDLTDTDSVRALMTPREAGRFTAHPVSTRVNSVRNNGAELVAPAPVEELVGVVDPMTGEVLGGQAEQLF